MQITNFKNVNLVSKSHRVEKWHSTDNRNKYFSTA